MSFNFEQALDAAREAEGRTKILVTVSVNRDNGVIKCFTGTLCYSNKKQGEFISEETLSTTSDEPLQPCLLFSETNPQPTNFHPLQKNAGTEINFSISNNLVEDRIGLFKATNEESGLHVIKFEEKGSFLVGVEMPAKAEDGDILYTIAFTDFITDPIPNSSIHFKP